MKVLLINPISNIGNHVLPLGLASIAAYLQQQHVEVHVIDAWALNLDCQSLEQQVSAINPEIVGITVMSPRFNQAKATAEIARKAAPDALIVLGGPHPSAMPEETLRKIPAADVCVIGEGEITLLNIVKNYHDADYLSQIDGIAFRDETLQIKRTNPVQYIDNLDDLPFPARDLFPIDMYQTHPPYGIKTPYMTMITSRGCPYHCSYCSKEVFGSRLRMQSSQRVIDEIEHLIAKYGVKEIHFYDDDFTMNAKRVEEICNEILARKLKILWSCTTRVDLVNFDLLKKMKKAGCWLISYGVESGNQKILDTIQKGVTIGKIRDTFALTRKAGIKTLGYFLAGLPGETESTLKDSIEFSKQLNPDFAAWGVLIVFPGSPFYTMVSDGKFGGFAKIRDISNEEFAYHLVFEDNLTFEQSSQTIGKAFIDFHMRPTYILKKLFEIRSKTMFMRYYHQGISLLQHRLSK